MMLTLGVSEDFLWRLRLTPVDLQETRGLWLTSLAGGILSTARARMDSAETAAPDQPYDLDISPIALKYI